MEKNEVEDWLKLLLYTTCQDKELLSKILARARTLKTAHDVIDYVEAEECGKLNAERLLGGKAIVARVQDKQGKNIHCYACQNPGHINSECTVEKSKLYCQHCKKRGLHNTNRSCPEFKGNSNNRDKPGKAKEKTDKPVDKRTKRNKARTTTITEIEETPEEEDDEDSDSASSVSFIASRVQWWPLGEAGSEADSEEELEFSNDTDVFFFDSEYEMDDNPSEHESGYYTPPNSPQEQDENSLLTDDNDSLISEEGNTDLMPALLSDTESESDSDDNDDIFDDDELGG